MSQEQGHYTFVHKEVRQGFFWPQSIGNKDSVLPGFPAAIMKVLSPLCFKMVPSVMLTVKTVLLNSTVFHLFCCAVPFAFCSNLRRRRTEM